MSKKDLLVSLLISLVLIALMEVSIYLYQLSQKPSRAEQSEPEVTKPFWGDVRDDCANARIFDPNNNHTLTRNPDKRCANPYGIYKGGAFHYLPAGRKEVVFTLGGSTTDGTVRNFSDYKAWPYFVAIDPDAFPGHSVVNAGVAGYGSSQELLKFVRDGLPMRPGIVISLNGINENYNDDAWYRNFPYAAASEGTYQTGKVRTHTTQNLLMPKINLVAENLLKKLAPSTRSAAGERMISYLRDTEFFYDYSSVPAEDVWLQNVQTLHSIVAGYGGQYFVFLQPTLGLANALPVNGSRDAVMLDGVDKGYVEKMNGFYERLRKRCEYLEYCTDISTMLKDSSGLYHDPRHPNADGNKILEHWIVRIVKSKL